VHHSILKGTELPFTTESSTRNSYTRRVPLHAPQGVERFKHPAERVTLTSTHKSNFSKITSRWLASKQASGGEMLQDLIGCNANKPG
jgi:hypothetical protein